MANTQPTCEWNTLRHALTAFVENVSGHESSAHIKPLHWYVACRLVVEGGFLPEDIKPRPPFVATRDGRKIVLEHMPEMGCARERTILGGLKTKTVDVVAAKNGIGPVLAVSIKGSLRAFRNLTNRMEEAVGDCTNLHITYPAMVYGFLQVMRANREAKGVSPNDVAICRTGEIAEPIARYHDVLARLAGRDDVRSEVTKYEAVALALIAPDPPQVGEILRSFPPDTSPLLLGDFFRKLYQQYDQRFVYAAPRLQRKTRRVLWAPDSPAFTEDRPLEYDARIGCPEDDSLPPESAEGD